MPESVSLELGGRPFRVEVGKVAKQASEIADANFAAAANAAKVSVKHKVK